MKAQFQSYTLNFKRPGGTSRGVLSQKETYFLCIDNGTNFGIGECGMFKGLSHDDVPDYEDKGRWVAENIHLGKTTLLEELLEYPSLQFGLEQAFLSLESPSPFALFPSSFTSDNTPIAINGLVWMGSPTFMHQQIEEKLQQGFNCIKMKIGAVDFDEELRLLKEIRDRYTAKEITIRVDANGAFSPKEALDKLTRLAVLDIHSIEQPIKQGQWEEMARLCDESPVPIALDEELIGVTKAQDKKALMEAIRPQYIILKPSLIGGFMGSAAWISLADAMDIDWWVTSALESNIGLNAIAQWTATLGNGLPQGLGTGSLFTNNFKSPLEVAGGKLFYDPQKTWDTDTIKKLCT